ncbi:MAG: SCO family protein [Oryzihumus sp.]
MYSYTFAREDFTMGRRRIGRTGLAVAAALVATGTAVGFAAGTQGSSAAGEARGTGAGPTAPSYVLTDQNGRHVSSASFRGKVQVVSFLFPFCTTYCPVTARSMTQLEQELAHTAWHDLVQLVAFNVDPEGATVAHMHAFWSEFGGNPADPRVSFLTGTPQQVRRVVTGGFRVYYQKVTEAQQSAEVAQAKADGSYTPQPEVDNKVADAARVHYDIVHNDVIEIVGPRGRIERVFDNASQVSDAELEAAVVAAAKSA